MPAVQEQITNSVSTILPVPQTQTLSLSSLAEACGNEGKSVHLESPKLQLLRALRSRKSRAWQWCVLRREFRTFLSRIRYALGSVTDPYGGTLAGPIFQQNETGSLLPCQKTLARIVDTQQMPQVWKRWQVTPLDSELFLLGWTAGARWAEQCDRKIDIQIQFLK